MTNCSDDKDLATGPAADGAPDAGTEAGTGDEVSRLKDQLAERDRAVAELTDRVLRLQADFENFRRRTRLEKEELAAYVTEDLVLKLLPVVDNFERALSASGTQDAAGIMTGVAMIHRQFAQFLEKIGLEPIAAVGETFDPQLHEAVMRVEDPDRPEGTVTEELQKGYRMRGKALRPSMVKVVSRN